MDTVTLYHRTQFIMCIPGALRWGGSWQGRCRWSGAPPRLRPPPQRRACPPPGASTPSPPGPPGRPAAPLAPPRSVPPSRPRPAPGASSHPPHPAGAAVLRRPPLAIATSVLKSRREQDSCRISAPSPATVGQPGTRRRRRGTSRGWAERVRTGGGGRKRRAPFSRRPSYRCRR